MTRRFFIFVGIAFVALSFMRLLATVKMASDLKKIGVNTGIISSSTTITEYKRGDTTIILIGMIHLAHYKFYRGVEQYLEGRNFLVLTEGISDKTGLMNIPANFTLATDMESSMGVVMQNQSLKVWPNSMDADIDITEYSPQCMAGHEKHLAIETLNICPTLSGSFAKMKSLVKEILMCSISYIHRLKIGM